MITQIDKRKDQRKRITAIALWAIVGVLTTMLFLMPQADVAIIMLGHSILALPLITILAAVLYCGANKNMKDKKKLQFRSRVLLAISLVILFATFWLFMYVANETKAAHDECFPKCTAYYSMGITIWAIEVIPIFITGFLSFLITSIKLNIGAQKATNGRHKRPARQKKEYTDDSF